MSATSHCLYLGNRNFALVISEKLYTLKALVALFSVNIPVALWVVLISIGNLIDTMLGPAMTEGVVRVRGSAGPSQTIWGSKIIQFGI